MLEKTWISLPASFVLVLLLGGCRDVDDEPTPTEGLTVTLTNLFPDAGPTSYLVVRECTGALCQSLASASCETAELASLSVTSLEAASFEVVVYIPGDGDLWSTEQPFGEGYYAIASGLTDPTAQLWVSFWERLADPSEGHGGVLSADEEPVFGSIEGQVTDDEGQGVAGLTPWIEGQGFTGTDDSGDFTFERVIPGTTTLHVAGPGVEETSLEVEVGASPTPLAIPVALTSSGPPQRVEGLIIDTESVLVVDLGDDPLCLGERGAV